MSQQNFNILRICVMQYNGFITAISSFLKCWSVNRNDVTSSYHFYNSKTAKILRWFNDDIILKQVKVLFVEEIYIFIHISAEKKNGQVHNDLGHKTMNNSKCKIQGHLYV